jgi:hypothetical protein
MHKLLGLRQDLSQEGMIWFAWWDAGEIWSGYQQAEARRRFLGLCHHPLGESQQLAQLGRVAHGRDQLPLPVRSQMIPLPP